MGEDDCDGEAAGAFDVHEEGARSGNEHLDVEHVSGGIEEKENEVMGFFLVGAEGGNSCRG